ncbi:uncharacterized protein LOC103575738 isoform X1 [Microplitis demolitor]|uniref:uncharacterized protein LOC103575738 isoform X1 n=1 Tax=Microplitis demolitor TaxID=69319 RepID=UPI00043FFFD8|nr:uncharacterized protein LOC103575738 isoform X1 [Microplitis demolitor]
MIALLFFLGVCGASRIPMESMMEIRSKSLEDLAMEPSNFVQSSIHSIQPRYFVYNYLQVDPHKSYPVLSYPYGNPGNAYVTSSFNYYGAPLYDYGFQLSPQVFTNLQPFIPHYVPQQPSYVPQQPISTTTQRPFDDGIEKLDEKIDPDVEINPPMSNENSDDDSVVVESL